MSNYNYRSILHTMYTVISQWTLYVHLHTYAYLYFMVLEYDCIF